MPERSSTLQTVSSESGAKPPVTADLRHAASEQRVSNLVGDRLCATCGYNLTGQAVLREPHYNMLIVRCPECAAVASVQEYPLLGRWANRWAALGAGVWMLIVVGLWIGTGAAIFGFSIGTTETAAWKYSQFISNKYEVWRTQSSGQTQGQVTIVRNVNDWQTWWKQQDRDALFAEAGGWLGAVHWPSLLLWMPYAAVAFTLGCVWAAILIGRNWRGRMVAMLLIMTVALFFSSISYLEWQNDLYGWSWNSGRQELGPTFLGMSLVFGAIVLSAGLLVGRSIIRGLIRLLLPPRMRNSLAMLWTADGLKPPVH